MAAGLLVMVLVLLMMVLLAPAAAAGTANSLRSDLLPVDCGRRLVQPDDITIPRIVGTENTTAYHGQFPWQARIEVFKREWGGYRHQCGGIIITQRHVITAAHCVDDVALTSMQVRVGDLRFGKDDKDEHIFAVASFHVHNHFGKGTSFANDIALLRLKARRGVGIEFGQFVQPACLPEADTVYEPNTVCEVSGWGKTADEAPISETLRGALVPLVSDEFCSASEVHQVRFVRGRMFCAGLVRGGPDACGGDSGGPLVCRDPSSDRFVAYGIVSSGDPQGCGHLPGLYTKLAGFVSWLLARLQLDLGEKSDAVPTFASPGTKLTITPPHTDLLSRLQMELGRTSHATTTSTPTDRKPTTSASAESAADCGRSDFSPTHVNADFVRQTDLPWLVSIIDSPGDTDSGCTGTVVSDRWILTSADCAEPDSWLKTPFAAVMDVTTGAVIMKFNIIHSIVHPDFTDSRGYFNDLGLLQTAERMPSSNHLPKPSNICLPGKHVPELEAGRTFVTTSWDVGLSGNDSSFELNWYRVTVIDDTECRRRIGESGWGPNFRGAPSGSVFCGRYLDPAYECEDPYQSAGHPLMAARTENGLRRWTQLALNTGVGLDCVPGEPQTDVFISLRSFTEWIREVISSA